MTPGVILATRRVRAHEGGAREDARVMFVHGWLMDARVWDPLLEKLDVLGDLLLPDLRGVGQTGGAGVTGLDPHVDDLLALAGTLGWERFAVVGHSMGGLIAQRLAARVPARIRRLGLLAPVPAGGVPLDDATRSHFLSLAGNPEALDAFFSEQLVDPSRAAWLAEIAGDVAPEAAAQMFQAWSGADFADTLHRIEAPTWVAAGAADPYLPPARVRAQVAERIPGAQFSVIPGAGHYPQVDCPKEVAAWVAQMFLT